MRKVEAVAKAKGVSIKAAEAWLKLIKNSVDPLEGPTWIETPETVREYFQSKGYIQKGAH